jgi:hypothetical protein
MSAFDVPTLSQLWVSTRAYGASIHSGPDAPDGREAWQPIKAISSAYPEGAKWSSRITSGPAKDAATLTLLKALELLGGKSGEDAHYYTQMLRIPMEQACSLRKVLQVAFNIGQLVGSGALERLGAVNKELPELFTLHRLDSLDTYCPDPSGIDAQIRSMGPNMLYAPGSLGGAAPEGA